MVPLPGPSCALEIKTWLELVGRNSLPNGPAPCAAKGEPGAALRWPSSSTLKLSISDGKVAATTPVPMRRADLTLRLFGEEPVIWPLPPPTRERHPTTWPLRRVV